jgi:hypothetical protein
MPDPAQHANCLALVFTIVGACAAILAAAVSAWMAVETRRMATATKRSVDLEYLPILGIRDVRIGVSPTNMVQIDAQRLEPTALSAVTIAIELQNAGRVVLNYRMRAMSVTFAGRTSDIQQYLSRGGIVLPGSSTHFWHPALALDPPVSTFPAKGRVHCDFEYWHDPDAKPAVLKATIEYTIAGCALGSATHWIFVDESA